MRFILALIAVAIGLIVVSILVKGVLYLLAIGIVVLVLALIFGAVRARTARPRTRR